MILGMLSDYLFQDKKCIHLIVIKNFHLFDYMGLLFVVILGNSGVASGVSQCKIVREELVFLVTVRVNWCILTLIYD